MRSDNEKILKKAKLMAKAITGGAEASLARALVKELEKAIKQDEKLYPMRSKYPVTFNNNLDSMLKSYDKLSALLERQQQEERELKKAFRFIKGNRMLKAAPIEACAFNGQIETAAFIGK